MFQKAVQWDFVCSWLLDAAVLLGFGYGKELPHIA